MKISRKSILYFLAAQILIFYVSAVNVSPDGFLYVAGDTYQFFNFEKILHEFRYVWFHFQTYGEGGFLQYSSYSLFYYLIYIISNLFRMSPSSQSFLYYFLFFEFSFLGFYISSYIFKPKEEMDTFKRCIFSLLYSFNPFVFYVFFHIWGFQASCALYYILPLIFAFTYKYFIIEQSYRTLSCLGIIFFLVNIPNGNLSFFVSLLLVLNIYIVLLFIFNKNILSLKRFLINICLFYLILGLSVSWTLLPQIKEMLRIASRYAHEERAILEAWLRWQALKLIDIFYLLSPKFELFFKFAIFFFIFPFLFYLKGNPFSKKRRMSIIYMVLLIIVMLIGNKFKGIISEQIIPKIFNIFPLNSIRSAEKTVIFLPYLLILIAFLNMRKGKGYGIVFVFLLSALSIYPFFTGKMQTNYSAVLEGQGSHNYLTAVYSPLVKIPESYFDISQKLNSDLSEHKILRIPYNVINSVGWVNFPKWKQVGGDITIQLFEHPTVQMNSFGAWGNWNYGKEWNSQSECDSRWLLPLAGMLNVKYIIYHKDIDKQFIKQTIDKVRYYEKENLITKLDENEYFNLYELNSRYFLPHLYGSCQH